MQRLEIRSRERFNVRLFHFSEDPGIKCFEPRPVLVPVERPAGMEWLNGNLVWAIAESHEKMYLFPRECTRIVMWATPHTSDEDAERWLGGNRELSVA